MLNLTNTEFSEEENDILEKGLNYAIERPLANNLDRNIVDMQNAISMLDEHLKKGHFIIAFNKLKHIITSHHKNTKHKRLHHVAYKLKQKLTDNKLTIVKKE